MGKTKVIFNEIREQEQLHEWAKINLLPQEDADTRLRFEEGVEDYDDDYIKEMYLAKNK